jgi:sugar phosphate isomerase/epimerase
MLRASRGNLLSVTICFIMFSSIQDRLAVCSWSLQPANPQELFARLQSIGLSRLQLALDPLRESPDVWSGFGGLCEQHGVRLVSGMFGTIGEDYTSLESIRLTGGVVPDATWQQNWQNIRLTAALAQELGLSLVSMHAGFLPHDESDPDYRKLRQRLEQIAAAFAEKNIDLALETGQETASALRDFLERLKCPNLGVNFDPANMILYGKGDPIEAMRVLGPWIKQVHIKDAVATRQPGTWGEEVAAGTGEVDWNAFFATLGELGFQGNFCIEREAGNQRVADILTAKQMIEAMG